jgi:hypothetical protein
VQKAKQSTNLDSNETSKKVKKAAKKQQNNIEDIKTNKRKFDNNLDLDESVELIKPKKKLKVVDDLMQPSKSTSQLEIGKSKKLQKQFSAPTFNKIKQVVPKEVKVEKTKKESKKGFAFPEPGKTLPRPVWTTSGYFMEENLTPQKKSKKTIPVVFNGSVSVGLSDGTKLNKKDRKKAPLDFKSKQILLKQLKRDGSMKNMKGLMMKKI